MDEANRRTRKALSRTAALRAAAATTLEVRRLYVGGAILMLNALRLWRAAVRFGFANHFAETGTACPVVGVEPGNFRNERNASSIATNTSAELKKNAAPGR